mmetsp:Transcript_13843/g.19957  ORF Transcript_13843/g.19957 Transcript_13843/m.19957 type:complete len:102 (+) Transcript_13843:427-732(+)
MTHRHLSESPLLATTVKQPGKKKKSFLVSNLECHAILPPNKNNQPLSSHRFFFRLMDMPSSTPSPYETKKKNKGNTHQKPFIFSSHNEQTVLYLAQEITIL